MLYQLSYASLNRTRRKSGAELERETGIEPATNSLEGCDSTIELLPPEPCHHGAHASDAPYYSMGKGKGAATEAGNGGRPSRRSGAATEAARAGGEGAGTGLIPNKTRSQCFGFGPGAPEWLVDKRNSLG